MSFKFKGKGKVGRMVLRPVDRQQNKKIKTLNAKVKRLNKANEKKYDICNYLGKHELGAKTGKPHYQMVE